MAFTQTEDNRIQTIENAINTLSTAQLNLATRKELKNLLALLQRDIVEIRVELEQLELTGSGNALANHKIDPDAHSNLFVTESEGADSAGKAVKLNDLGMIDDSMLPPSTVDHGLLTGLTDDDHSQYHNNTRGDTRYFQKTEFLDVSAGSADSGKPVILNGDGLIDPTMVSLLLEDHGSLSGLSDDDHTQYLRTDGARTLTGNMLVDNLITVDGRDISIDGAALDTTVTQENITITVDYNAVDAITSLSSSVLFSKQAQVTAALAGASAFKYLKDVWNALPKLILHTVTINLAAGTHRPRSSDTTVAWDMNGRTVGNGGSIVIAGAPATSNTVIASTQTVTGFSASGGSPYVECTGTPFTENALKGYILRLSNGQTTTVNRNTTSRIYVLDNLSPAPVIGTTTFVVGQPATVLRNSINDSATIANQVFRLQTANPYSLSTTVLIQDLVIDPFGATTFVVTTSSSAAQFTRILIDEKTLESFGKTPNAIPWAFSTYGSYGMTNCATIATLPNPVGSSIDTTLSLGNWTQLAVRKCIFMGGEGITCGRYSQMVWNSSVVDSAVRSGSATVSAIYANGNFGGQDTGARSEIRNTVSGALAALFIDNNDLYFIGNSSVSHTFLFTDNASASCVRLGLNTLIDWMTFTSSIGGWVDGGGNTGIGIDLIGPAAVLKLNTPTNVTGTLGDLRLNGTILTYADIASNGPYVDPSGSYVDK